ncbi:MAG: hypothetical protein LH603_17200 [Pseudonocardia sp.]|nr:hypothetical protein [Pseudonocardia sp.]
MNDSDTHGTGGGCRVPAGRLLWSLVEDAVVVDRAEEDGGLSVVRVAHRVDVDRPSATVREALRRMCLGPVALENVAGLRGSFASWRSGGDECEPWREVKRMLDALGGMVVLSLTRDAAVEPLVSMSVVDAAGAVAPLALAEPERYGRVGLRPGVSVRRIGASDVLQAEDSAYQLVLHAPPAIRVGEELSRGPRSAVELAGPDLGLPLVLDVLSFLTAARTVERAADVPAEVLSRL